MGVVAKRILLILISCLLYVQASADGGLNFERVKTNNAPFIQAGAYVYSVLDSSNRCILVLSADTLFTLHFDSHKWIKSGEISTPSVKMKSLEMGFNSLSGQLLFWDRGIGRVFTLNNDSTGLKRIDNSFNHKNQFGHVSFFRSEPNSIHTFSGYGLWNWKNMITRFNIQSGEWSIQSIQNSSPIPIARTNALGAYQSETDKLYILGGSGPEKGRADDKFTKRLPLTDLWSFDFDSARWSKIGNVKLPKIDHFIAKGVRMIGRVNDQARTAFDATSNQWYIPVRRPDGVLPGLLKIDITSPSAQLISQYSGDFERQHVPIGLFYDQDNSRLLLLVYENATSDTYRITTFQVSQSELDTAFSGRPNLLEKKRTASIPFTTIGYIIILFGIGGIGYLLYVKGYFQKITSSSTKRGTPNEINISVDADESSLIVNGEKITNLFHQQEWDLIQHLIHQKDESIDFIPTHKIEEHLWPDRTDSDYVRKMRNDLIANINKKFSRIDEFPGDWDFIVGRKSKADRRKMEYGINPDIYITVRSSN